MMAGVGHPSPRDHRFLYKCYNNHQLRPYYFFLNNTGEVSIIGKDRARTEVKKTASA